MMKLRIKVWTSPEGKRYMATVGMRGIGTEKVMAYMLSDDSAISVEMSTEEWNALSFSWFVEESVHAEDPLHAAALWAVRAVKVSRTVAELRADLLKACKETNAELEHPGLTKALEALPDLRGLACVPERQRRAIRYMLEECSDYA